MLEALIAVLVLSTITAALAAVLVVAERYLRNYGACDIGINDDKKITITGGGTLLEALSQNKVFIPSACGGRGTCAYCKVKVLEGGGAIVPTEEPLLAAGEIAEGIRLSCQVRVRNNIRIQVPAELLAVKEYRCACARIRDLTHDIKEFQLELKDPPEIGFVPGQYIQLLSPAYDKNEEVYRAYSISSDPADKRRIELVIRLVPGGICTTWCFQHLRQGQEVRINGPYGDFHLRNTEAPMIMVAGGSGMAPIKCLLHHMKNTGNRREAVFFFGANRVKELFYLDSMKEFEKGLPRFRFVPVVAKPGDDETWDGERGLVTEVLKRQIQDASGHEGYLCGSPGMIDAAINVLTGLGMPADKIYFDKF